MVYSANSVDRAPYQGHPKPIVIGPRNMETNLQLRRSTKQLINRYESLSIPPAPRPVYSTASAKFFRAINASKENFSVIGKQDKSHLRQSFSNLLSVFKIGKTLAKDGNTSIALSSSGSDYAKSSPPVDSNATSHATSCGQVAQPITHTGTLLYLSRPSAGQRASLILPVWTSCTVELKRGEIRMTWLSTQGNPSTHVISLASCADVRSLALDQLDSSEIALLPTKVDSEELKVFEILFEGRPREKFAATSVQERAGWVSAIWDAILAPQGSLGDTKGVISRVTRSVSCRSERSLPPTPVEITSSLLPPLNDGVSLSDQKAIAPQTVTIQGPDTKNSTAVGLTKNIAQLDVTSGMLDSGTIELQHRGSLRSNDGDSILDSYGDTKTPFIAFSDNTFASMADKPTAPLMNIRPTTLPDPPLAVLDSPASVYPVANDIRYGLLAEHLRNQVTQTTGFADSLCSIQSHVQTFSRQINTLVDATPLWNDVNRVVKDIHRKTDDHGDEIRILRDKLNKFGNEVQERVSLVARCSDAEPLRRTLEDVLNQQRSEFPRILKALEEIQIIQADSGTKETPCVVLNNLRPSSHFSNDGAESGSSEPYEQPMSSFLSKVEGKLDELLSLYRTTRENDAGVGSSPDFANFQQATQQLRTVLDSLNNESSHRTLREQQQDDSVRYLNDLNTWLETFVKNSTIQMRETAFGVQKLCHAFGSSTEASDLPQSDSDAEGPRTVLGDIRQLILETRKREADTVELKSSIDVLVGQINKNADVHNGFTPETVINLLNRQRQDQEGLLRALTAELSSEIRGERLRFVEAMKEATAINVQSHVEQFKKELNREVMVMTREIERLYREKQAVENQIADLFAFYSKHKQAANTLPGAQHIHTQQSQRQPQVHNQRLPGYYAVN